MNKFIGRFDAKFKNRVYLLCCEELENKGFTRYRKSEVDWPLHDGFHAWVGLNMGLYPDRVVVEPHIGVHVEPIERICTIKVGLTGRKYDRRVSTYAVHIKELKKYAEDWGDFIFNPQQSDGLIKSGCARLARLYATVGLDYARSIASYEALLPLLRSRLNMLGGYPESYASCLYLMGRKEEAVEFIKNFPEKWGSYIQGFADPFLAMVEDDC